MGKCVTKSFNGKNIQQMTKLTENYFYDDILTQECCLSLLRAILILMESLMYSRGFLFVNQGLYIPKCSSRQVYFKNGCFHFLTN